MALPVFTNTITEDEMDRIVDNATNASNSAVITNTSHFPHLGLSESDGGMCNYPVVLTTKTPE